ncbi:MAG: hypothetical protein M0P71_07280 [Melioribacteraceae bacterium]|jgi:hypothetical protein|nr:hypothetical protein [Melioribacteraceae bacterium]
MANENQIAFQSNAPRGSIVTIKNVPYQIEDLQEDFMYDTIIFGSRTADVQIAQGATFDFFMNISGKGKNYTNLQKDKSPLAGKAWKIYYVGLIARVSVGEGYASVLYAQKLLENLYLELMVTSDTVVRGPFWEWESGRGMSMYTTDNNVGTISAGVPASNSKRARIYPFDIVEQDELSAQYTMPTTNLVDQSGNAIIDATHPLVMKTGNVVAITLELRGLSTRKGVRSGL